MSQWLGAQALQPYILTEQAVAQVDSTAYLVGANRPMLGGSGYHISTLGFKGYISDFRITTGLATRPRLHLHQPRLRVQKWPRITLTQTAIR